MFLSVCQDVHHIIIESVFSGNEVFRNKQRAERSVAYNTSDISIS